METSGTVLPQPGLAGRWIDQWNVSPKLASPGNGGAPGVPEALRWFTRRTALLLEVRDHGAGGRGGGAGLVERYGALRRVLLMPEGTTRPGGALGVAGGTLPGPGLRYSTRLRPPPGGQARALGAYPRPPACSRVSGVGEVLDGHRLDPLRQGAQDAGVEVVLRVQGAGDVGATEAVLLPSKGRWATGTPFRRRASTIVSVWAGGTTASSRPWKKMVGQLRPWRRCWMGEWAR